MSKSIQYLWIESSHCFEKQEFNFSQEYNIHYDEENNKLDINKNEKYVSNFFGDNTDVTAVVGKNGTGKTSLLNYISSINYYNGLYNNTHGNCIVVYLENGNLKIFCSPQIKERGIECDYEINELIDGNNFVSDIFFKNIRYEYFTTVFNKANTTKSENFGGYVNLSTYSMLKKSNKRDVDLFFLDEFSGQIKFFSANKDKISDFGINYPKYVTVWFNNNKNGIEDACRKGSENGTSEEKIKQYSDEIIKNCFSQKESGFKANFQERISCSMTLSIINRLIKIGLDNSQCKQMIEIIKTSFGNGQKTDTELWINPFDKLKGFLSEIERIFRFSIKEYETFIEYLENRITFKSTADLFHLKTLRFFMSVDEGQDKYLVDIDASLSEFVEKYKATIADDDYLLFEWGLSSGEMLLLTAYTRFYDDKIKNSSSNIQNRIILLDEAEVSFHPEWQRIYLSNMMSFFSDLYKDCHIQLIIATHSPIILSDIPKQNIVYISKDTNGRTKVDSNDIHEETFGANIYKLYNNAFFMDNGAVGEFAKDYIRRIKSDIGDSSKTYEEIEKAISIIGDEFIRNQLYLLLNQSEKVPKKVEKNDSVIDISVDELLKQMDDNKKEELFESLKIQFEQNGDKL